MCFKRLFTFKLAIFKPYNLEMLCNVGPDSAIVGSRQAVSNGKASCELTQFLVGIPVA